jgi:acyl-CoA synthetase (AMP-forming)/AMP-acid ligase II
MVEAVFENVRQLLESKVNETPDKEFLLSEEGGRVFSYREFNLAVDKAGSLLLSAGVRKGDRVSLLLANRVEYLVFYFACFKIGAWAGPVNSLLKPQEIEFIVGNSGAVVAVTEVELLGKLKESRRNLPTLKHIVVVDCGDPAGSEAESSGFESVLSYTLPANGALSRSEAEPLPEVQLSGDDEAVIIYTSGTTGKPKGVMLSHGNLLANARQIAEWLSLTSNDRALLIMPLFHVNALMTTCLAPLWTGGSVVLAPRFSASRHWSTIASHGVTYFGSVATMLSMLNLTHPDGLADNLDVKPLRFALCGSAPVPVEVINRFEALFHCPVIEGYGLSESTCRSTFNPVDERRRVGSVGLPIGNELRIFDDSDRELDAGAVGEIVLRGPNIMKGYYLNESATREAFRSGWFHTGDLGYLDKDRFVYVVDRKSDMIIRAGENIYPREIDEVLYQNPKVKDAATVGVPDPLYGEEVKAFVVLRDGQEATEKEIIEFCAERLADFKCPKSIAFVVDIPKGPTGKLLKRELG